MGYQRVERACTSCNMYTHGAVASVAMACVRPDADGLVRSCMCALERRPCVRASARPWCELLPDVYLAAAKTGCISARDSSHPYIHLNNNNNNNITLCIRRVERRYYINNDREDRSYHCGEKMEKKKTLAQNVHNNNNDNKVAGK